MPRRVRVIKELSTNYERWIEIPDDIVSGDPTEEWITDKLVEMDESENRFSVHGWLKIEDDDSPSVDHNAPDDVEEYP